MYSKSVLFGCAPKMRQQRICGISFRSCTSITLFQFLLYPPFLVYNTLGWYIANLIYPKYFTMFHSATMCRLHFPLNVLGNLIFQWLLSQCIDCEIKAKDDRSHYLLTKFLLLPEMKKIHKQSVHQCNFQT